MTSALMGLLACLLVVSAQAQQSNRSNKCKCSSSLLARFNAKLIQGEPLVHQPSSFCPLMEIIITTKQGKEKCLDPKSQLGKFILMKKLKEAGAAHLTTTSAQTSSSDSTRCHVASSK
uniref:Chemokine interleukin-8-like domain-containing protein n=1 Tax=Nothobranchius furzeri TaxID=105023 RepID=A0A8C6NT36_NOTFU